MNKFDIGVGKFLAIALIWLAYFGLITGLIIAGPSFLATASVFKLICIGLAVLLLFYVAIRTTGFIYKENF